ncbi:hypothetical protein Nepgr_000107 [Nepenthes gracilis]|uniref:DCD domain-containing protein n=1 Tax=Nepenthes gracilis TaxID=150966 RepID=A0AAD3P4Q0_NEPGR|nr:hypothetical protein Nepgr_000107 [Nepenthes gracilis]
MVSAKGKGKTNDSKSKVKRFGLSDDPTETTIEKLMAVPGHEEKENSFREVEMGEEEDIDEMIVEGEKIGAGHEVEERNAEEVESEEKEASYKTNTEGSVVVPRCEEKEDGIKDMKSGECVGNHMKNEMDKECRREVPHKERDSSTPGTVEVVQSGEVTAVCKRDAEELVVSESELKGEIMVGNTANDVERIASQMSSDVQMGDIVGKNKVKKSHKIIKRNVVMQRGKIITNSEGKPESSEGTKPAGELKNVDASEHVKEEEKVDAKLVNKVKNLREVSKKKVVQRPTDTVPDKNDKPKPSDKQRPGGKEELTEEELVRNIQEETKSNIMAKRTRKRSRSKAAKRDGNNGPAEDKEKAETSKMIKSKKRSESMGMIFMCSSKTKEDCYRYKVMGLPESKLDMVLKVYKGMRIFLFDFDLRLLYGIYKAAGPGGYNIEPMAFKSQFPSQVRFTVLEDCLPLEEEKFRQVIKDNYYAKNKFNCKLSSEQVKNLCELFQAVSKGKDSKLERGRVSKRTRVISLSRKQGRNGRRAPEAARHPRLAKDNRYRRPGRDEVRHDRVIVDNGYRRQARDEVRRDHVIADSGHGRQAGDGVRLDRVIVDNGYDWRPLPHEREAFVPTIVPPAPLPARSLSYAYGRTSGTDVYHPREMAYEQRGHTLVSGFDAYRRDPAVEHHDLELPGLEVRRLQDEPELHEPYASYRQSLVRREPIYSADVGREYYDYSQAGPMVEYSRPAMENAAYGSFENLYRRY